jgi:isopentenyl-diphosphate delta-isomerase
MKKDKSIRDLLSSADATKERKLKHLETCLTKDVEIGNAGFGDVYLVHNAFPEINYDEVDTSVEFFGKKLDVPLIINSMTGGHPVAGKINRQLAKVAEKKHIGFALGSQRAMLEDKNLTETYQVRDVAPNVLLFGNIGITKLNDYSISQIEEMLSETGADALFVHLNPAQELFQAKPDVNYSRCFEKLRHLCKHLNYPVIAKEVGDGFCREAALSLQQAGVKALSVDGYGGTNWVRVDGLISGKDTTLYETWGIPTACSILESKVGLPIIAAGGIRSGLDMAKAIALGADVCGIALPILKCIYDDGSGKLLENYIDTRKEELKKTMFLTNSPDIISLKKANYILKDDVKNWAEQRGLK